MSSDSEPEVIETKIPSDERWIKSLDTKEKAYFDSNLISLEELEDLKVVCSACFKQGNHKQRGFFVRHPTLGVVVCKNCKSFYFEGSWSKDDEGKFEYCGWCAQGGELFCCTLDHCPNAFCTKCVKRNLGRKVVSSIEDSSDWQCFECKPEQLRQQRLLYYSILNFWKKHDEKLAKKEKAKSQKEKVKARSDCITRSLSDASDCANLEKTILNKESKKWSQISDSDYSKVTVKFEAAKNFAKFLAVRQKNLNQLKSRFFDHVDKDSFLDEEQRQEINRIVEDLDSISNGDLAEIALEKEKVKLQVLQSSDEEESNQKLTNGNDENHDLDSSPDEAQDSEEEPSKRSKQKPKSKRESVKIKLFSKKKVRDSSGSEPEQNSDDESASPKKNSSKKTEQVQEDPEPVNGGEEFDGVDDSIENDEESESPKKPGPKNSKSKGDSSNSPKKSLSETESSPKKAGPKSKTAAVSESKVKNEKVSDGSEIETTPSKEENHKSVKKEVLATSEDSDLESSPAKISAETLTQNYKAAKKEVLATSDESESESPSKKSGPKSKTSKSTKKSNQAGDNKHNKNSIKKESQKNSEDDDSEADFRVPKAKGKGKKSTKKEVPSNSDLTDDDDDDDKVVNKLQEKFNKLIDAIDVQKDSKLNGTCETVVERLSSEQEVELKENENTLVVKQEEKVKSKRQRESGAKFDSEINRLCDLGALKKLTKRNSGKSASKQSKKMRNGKAKAAEVEVQDLSSDNSDDDVKAVKKRGDSATSRRDLAREAVLASSDDDESDVEMKNGDAKKNGNKKKSDESSSKSKSSSSRSSKRRGADPDFMRTKLNETDSEEEEAKAKKRKEKARKAVLDDSDSDFEITEVKESKKGSKRSKKRNDSDDDDSDIEEVDEDISEEENAKNKGDSSDSDIGAPKKKVAKSKKRKKKGEDSSSPEDSDEEPRPKKKRKRIKKTSSGDEDENDDNDDENESPSKKSGRKDIRKIIKDKKLSKETKTAAEEEKERRKRVADNQALYNELTEIKENAVVEAVPLDIEPDSKEVLVEVDKTLCRNLKPHQARGIRFMFQSVFESKKYVESGKVPGGAILAHCMGLGKTLQTIGLVHTVMTNFPEQVKCVLVISPVNTVKNWEDEFHKWLKDDLENDVDVYEVSGAKDNWDRADRLKYWRKNGGALIMGYDMYRNLTNTTAKKFKSQQKKIFQETLVDPGPDLVVCDEGHILKNTKSALNIAMNKIKTRRRIILTGTPLQNNLAEYFAMVDFVKPKLLGTYNEFRNRFVNPITNGQASDSTDRDVRIMKKRSFILNDLLKGCMQRLDYNVLVPFLQPKYEYVLCICLTEFQKKLYSYYLENYARAGQIGSEGKLEGGKKGGLFYDVQNLSRVWNHPYILLKAKEKADIAKMFQDDAEEEQAFINDDDDESESEAKSTSDEDSDISEVEEVKQRKVTRKRRGSGDKLVGGLDEAKAEALASDKGWWTQFMKDPNDEDELLNVELGSKMMLLMDILKECFLIGDKVLVFSQSLLSLDLIEKFLYHSEQEDSSIDWTWKNGRDYYRMDGSTPPDMRKKWCNYFNNKKHTDMRLFLISTKAGGLGINLVAANRVIIFDASWNPAHDVQSIFRVYRFGQEKPVYIYRFLAKGTMEEKIYDRQVTKQSLSARVVDEHQIERHFTMNELAELYTFNDEPKENQPPVKLPQDKLLAELISKHKDIIWKIHDHDSLLENQVEENLTEEERKAAWDEYENEKKGIVNMTMQNQNSLNMNLMMRNMNPELIKAQYRIQYPHLTEDQLNQATRAYMMQIQSGITGRTAVYDKSHYQQEMARAKMMQQSQYPGVYNNANRGYRPTERVTSSDLSTAAQTLQKYQQMLQLQRAQQIMQSQQKLVSSRANILSKNSQKLTFQPPKPKAKVTETVTLDDDDSDEVAEVMDEDDNDGEEIVMEGNPEIEEYRPAEASTSKSRRGRPRIDPETDP